MADKERNEIDEVRLKWDQNYRCAHGYFPNMTREEYTNTLNFRKAEWRYGADFREPY